MIRLSALASSLGIEKLALDTRFTWCFKKLKCSYCCLNSPCKLTALIFYARKRKNVHWIDISAIDYFEVSHLLPVILGENYHRRKQPF